MIYFSVPGCAPLQWFEYTGKILYSGDWDTENDLWSIDTVALVMCKGDSIFPNGHQYMETNCESVFDSEIEAFVTKWRPDPEQCNLYFAY